MPLLTKADIHGYQDRAITRMYENDKALVLLPVGAGKTVVGWTLIAELMDEGHIKRPLIFAPLRVAQLVWPAEPNEWEHLKGRGIVNWGGEPKNWPEGLWRTSRRLWGSRVHAEQRLPKIKDVLKKRIMEAKIADLKKEEAQINAQIHATEPPELPHVLGYESLQWVCDLYRPGLSPFDLWMFDEIGKLKNPKSPRYKLVRKHTKEAQMVYGLNATPAPEGFEDLFTQVQIVDGGKLWGKSFYQWRKKYFVPADYQGYTWRLQIGALPLLSKDLNTVAFKVDEKELSYQKSMSHSQIKVQLPPKARTQYEAMKKEMQVVLDSPNPFKEDDTITAMSEAVVSMKLRQIAQGFIYDEEGEKHTLHSEKVHALSNLIDSLGREPLLVAYEFKEDLENIKKLWKNVRYLGAGVSSAKAADTVTAWNRRELPVLAIHPFSAGHGLNLQRGGSHICWYAIPWPLESFMQTNGRIDRQGQTRACYGHHIVAENTKDQDISNTLVQKDVSQQQIIDAITAI